jgi:hypothetical protein
MPNSTHPVIEYTPSMHGLLSQLRRKAPVNDYYAGCYQLVTGALISFRERVYIEFIFFREKVRYSSRFRVMGQWMRVIFNVINMKILVSNVMFEPDDDNDPTPPSARSPLAPSSCEQVIQRCGTICDFDGFRDDDGEEMRLTTIPAFYRATTNGRSVIEMIFISTPYAMSPIRDYRSARHPMSSMEYCIEATAGMRQRAIHLEIYAALAALHAHFVMGARTIVSRYMKNGVYSVAGSCMLNETGDHSSIAHDGKAFFWLGGSAEDRNGTGIVRSFVNALTTLVRNRAAKASVVVKIDPTMSTVYFSGTGMLDAAGYDDQACAGNAWRAVRHHSGRFDAMVDGTLEQDDSFLLLAGRNNAKVPGNAGTLSNGGNGTHLS